jgi:hypothetical protein
MPSRDSMKQPTRRCKYSVEMQPLPMAVARRRNFYTRGCGAGCADARIAIVGQRTSKACTINRSSKLGFCGKPAAQPIWRRPSTILVCEAL